VKWRKVKKGINNFFVDLWDKALAIIAFGVAGLLIWLLVQMVFWFYGFSVVEWMQNIPVLYPTITHLIYHVQTGSELGVFYLFFFSSLFFLPVPLEALYINFLRSLPFEKIFIIAVAGIVLGQIINYWLGRTFGFIFREWVRKSARKKIRHRLDNQGILAILAVHIIPFPFQIFNLIAGVFRYKFFKWLLFVIIGLAIKHLLMYWIFVMF
jgi:membrane protein YqaA with SNARE-associated domain